MSTVTEGLQGDSRRIELARRLVEVERRRTAEAANKEVSPAPTADDDETDEGSSTVVGFEDDNHDDGPVIGWGGARRRFVEDDDEDEDEDDGGTPRHPAAAVPAPLVAAFAKSPLYSPPAGISPRGRGRLLAPGPDLLAPVQDLLAPGQDRAFPEGRGGPRAGSRRLGSEAGSSPTSDTMSLLDAIGVSFSSNPKPAAAAPAAADAAAAPRRRPPPKYEDAEEDEDEGGMPSFGPPTRRPTGVPALSIRRPQPPPPAAASPSPAGEAPVEPPTEEEDEEEDEGIRDDFSESSFGPSLEALVQAPASATPAALAPPGVKFFADMLTPRLEPAELQRRSRTTRRLLRELNDARAAALGRRTRYSSM